MGRRALVARARTTERQTRRHGRWLARSVGERDGNRQRPRGKIGSARAASSSRAADQSSIVAEQQSSRAAERRERAGRAGRARAAPVHAVGPEPLQAESTGFENKRGVRAL